MSALGCPRPRRIAAIALGLLVLACGRAGSAGDALPDSALTPSPESASAPPNDKMSAPASPTTSPQGRDLEGSPWRLVSVLGDSAPLPDSAQRATLTFDAATKRASGSGGCNRISGGYERNADSLRFSPMVATRMACPQGMEREAAFLNALGATRTFTIHGDTLMLNNEARVTVARLVSDPK
jgi:heat shock protein HslJ